MRSLPDSKLRVAVAILASWLVLLPILQALHLGTASHGHRYCQAHQRIEDVPWTAPGALASPDDTRRLRTAYGHAAAWSETPCALSNASVLREPAALDAPLVVAGTHGPTSLVSLSATGRPAARDLLLAAPKHSPPALLG
jgi:hypothetical protein